MKVYVAGPMTGIPKFNFPAFDAAAASLRAAGFDVVSPAELDDPEDRAAALASETGSSLEYGKGQKKTWGQFLARDVLLIADDGIDAIFVLSGWSASRGARLETFVGFLCGIPVYEYQPDFPALLVAVPPVALVRAWAGSIWRSVFRSVQQAIASGLEVFA